MSKKRRMSFRLDKDEALVVAPVHFWEGLNDYFHAMADDEPDSLLAAEWRNCAAHVSQWLERTRYTEQEEEEIEVAH